MIRRPAWLDAALGAVTALVAVVLYAPLVTVCGLSFFQLVRVRGDISFAGFSLAPYAALADNDSVMAALRATFEVGVVATILSVVLGLTCAFFYVGSRGALRQIMQVVIFLPFLLPPIITGLALLIFFREAGVPRGLPTIIVGHTILTLPLVYRTILVRLQALGPSLSEASLDLGASRWQTLRLVLLPQLRLSIVVAALLAFAVSFDETLVTLFLAGSDSTLPIRLWAMMRVGFVPEINALATLVFGFATLVVVGVAILQGRATRDA